MNLDTGYLMHGSGNGPFSTESVRVKHEYADRWLAFYEGRWRRVHIQLRGMYIVAQGERIKINIEGL